MRFKLTFMAFFICLGIMTAGIILADHCLTVFGMIAMSLNACINSVCYATVAPVQSIHRYINEEGFDNGYSSGNSPELGNQDSK